MPGPPAPPLPERAFAEGPSPEREAAADPDPGLGVYIHFPWCIKKCPYCDFLSVPTAQEDIPHTRYADAVLAELEARRAELGERRLRSVFFGGGTPSMWKSRELGRVLRGVLASFDAGGATPEITVECNPGSLGPDKARALLDAGVNRLSIGVQALDDARLRFLGRWHDAARALRSVEAAVRSGMPRVSADLIYGVAEQTPESAAAEVSRLVELGLSHVSAYALTIEPQTAFGALARKGRLPQAPEQAVAESFLAVDEVLARRGFEHYEISNFARPGQRAEHNLGYWRGLDYVGLGCGAWGTVSRGGQRIRYRNRPQAQAFQDTALALGAAPRSDWAAPRSDWAAPRSDWAASPSDWAAPRSDWAAPRRQWTAAPPLDRLRELESESEALSPEIQLSEALMLGLRLLEGLDAQAAAARTGAELWTPARRRSARRLIAQGRLVEEGPRLSIPPSAWLLSDGIISELL